MTRKKEQAIVQQALAQLQAGVSKPRTPKRLEKVWQRVGQPKAQTTGHRQF